MGASLVVTAGFKVGMAPLGARPLHNVPFMKNGLTAVINIIIRIVDYEIPREHCLMRLKEHIFVRDLNTKTGISKMTDCIVGFHFISRSCDRAAFIVYKTFHTYSPVEPKPAWPRLVSSSSSTTCISNDATGTINT